MFIITWRITVTKKFFMGIEAEEEGIASVETVKRYWVQWKVMSKIGVGEDK